MTTTGIKHYGPDGECIVASVHRYDEWAMNARIIISEFLDGQSPQTPPRLIADFEINEQPAVSVMWEIHEILMAPYK